MKDNKEEIIKYVIDHVGEFMWDKIQRDDLLSYETVVCGQTLSINYMNFNDNVIRQEITLYCPETDTTRPVPTSLTNILFEKVEQHYKKMEHLFHEARLVMMDVEDDIYYRDIINKLKNKSKVSKKRQTNKQTIK